jgi:hypothetical protein
MTRKMRWMFAALALSAAACSKKDAPEAPSPTKEDRASEAPAPEATAAATTPSADPAPPAPAPAESGAEADGPPDGRRGAMDPDKLLKKLDKNGDGALDSSEIPDRMRKRLDRADTNHDGKVTADELRQLRKPRDRGDRKARKHAGAPTE